MSQRRRQGNLGLLLLGAQIMNVGIDNIPPVTLSLIGGQTAIYLGFIPMYFRSAASVCMSTYLVWHRQDWARMFLSQFYHADDMHLYFNMVSLLIKGRSLERRFGSMYFAWMVGVFTTLTGIGYIGINMLLEDRFQSHSYATQCAVGFSGVLFALKVVTTHYQPPGMQYALGFIPVPSRSIYWVELALISMITPNASFTGHLAGILVGLLYIKGPLKPIMDAIVAPAAVSREGGRRTGFGSGSWFSDDSEDAGSSRRPTAPPGGDYFYENRSHRDGHQYTQYTGGMSEEEQIRRAMQNSRQDYSAPPPPPNSQQGYRGPPPPPPPPPGIYPDLDDLRARRAERYQRYQ